MTYELANDSAILAVTDDLDEALELLEGMEDTWINVFDEHDKYLYTIDAE